MAIVLPARYALAQAIVRSHCGRLSISFILTFQLKAKETARVRGPGHCTILVNMRETTTTWRREFDSSFNCRTMAINRRSQYAHRPRKWTNGEEITPNKFKILYSDMLRSLIGTTWIWMCTTIRYTRAHGIANGYGAPLCNVKIVRALVRAMLAMLVDEPRLRGILISW